MIQNYLKAGYPALCVLTQEPHRAEQLLICEHWQFVTWDCIQGIRKAGSTQVIDEIKDPVEAINWLSMYKDTATILGWPLIRLDIGSLKGSLVGESERRIREATQVIDAFGEVIVWIDELEKAFAGTRSSGDLDAGTTANMFGHFLTWIQENDTSAIVMATANDISKLPPEFIRAGRFDATFFVDLPTTVERVEIIKIMNRKYGSNISTTYAQKLNGFTGKAFIEESEFIKELLGKEKSRQLTPVYYQKVKQTIKKYLHLCG